MEILSLTTDSFRNLAPARVDLHPRLNLVLGANGQGKTNLLEAVALVSGRASFRTSETREALKEGAREAVVSARLLREGRGETLGMSLADGARAHTLDGRRITRLTASRRLPAVFLTGEDLTRLTGAPAPRRRALDRVAFALEPGYAAGLAAYERARAAKARLLSSPRAIDRDELAVYEEALAVAGGRVAAVRRRAVAVLSQAFAREAERLASPFSSSLSLSLVSDLPAEGNEASLAEALAALVAAHAPAEARAGRSLVGPHRDDVLVASGLSPVAAKASSGENRTLVLAWTLAELAILRGAAGTAPVLAFDDFDSEWDRGVLATFASALPRDTQVLLTSARPEAVSELPFPPGATHDVEKGAFAARAAHALEAVS